MLGIIVTLIIWTDMSKKAIQMQLKPESDQGLHCLSFSQRFLPTNVFLLFMENWRDLNRVVSPDSVS